MSILADIARHQTIRPIRPENRVVRIRKLPDGGMKCVQASGAEFTIPAGEDQMQAFVIFTMLHANEL